MYNYAWVKDFTVAFLRALNKEVYPGKFSGVDFKYDSIVHYFSWRCNSHCITCNCWKTPEAAKDKEVWNAASLTKFYSTIKVEKVYITGGEPTVLPEFKEMVKAIHDASRAQMSFTVNALDAPKIEADLIWLKARRVPFTLSISCNGFEDVHDFSRGTPGNYQKINALTEFLKNERIPFYFLYAVFPFNLDKTEEFVRHCRSNKINVGISFARFDRRLMVNADMKENVFLSDAQVKKADEIILRLSQDYPEYLYAHKLLTGMIRHSPVMPCFGLYKRLVIDPYGGVFPCDGLPEEMNLGNLREAEFDFKKLLEVNRDKWERVFETIRDKRCQPCNYICDLSDALLKGLARRERLGIFMRLAGLKIKKIIRGVK